MAANYSAVKTTDYNPRGTRYAASIRYEPLRPGLDGTLQTLSVMAQAVRGEISPDHSGWSSPDNQQVAASIVRGSDNEAAALLRFIRDQIHYVEHPWDMQVVQDCRRTLESRAGDCVSKSVCLATLLGARGIVSRFVAQAPDGVNHDHVYVEALINGQWVPLDPTADGLNGRPLGDVGWRHVLPEGGIETPYPVFF